MLGADLNSQNKDGNTPLHQVVQNAEKLTTSKPIWQLVKKGASISIKNKDDLKPIGYLN